MLTAHISRHPARIRLTTHGDTGQLMPPQASARLLPQ